MKQFQFTSATISSLTIELHMAIKNIAVQQLTIISIVTIVYNAQFLTTILYQ